MGNPLNPNVALSINPGLLGGGQSQINPLDLARTAIQIQEGQNQITMQRNQIAAKNGMADLIASTPPDQVASRLAASPYFPWAPDVAETRTRMDLQQQQTRTSAADQGRIEAQTGQINLQTTQTALQSAGQMATQLMLAPPSEWNERIANIRQTAEAGLASATPAQRAASLDAIDSLYRGLTAGIDPNDPNASAIMRDHVLAFSTRFDMKPDQIALMSSHGGTFQDVDGVPTYRPFGTQTDYPMLPSGAPGSWTPLSPAITGTGVGNTSGGTGVMGTTPPPPMGAGPGGLGGAPQGAPPAGAPPAAAPPAAAPAPAPAPQTEGAPVPSGPPGSGQEPGGPAQTMRYPFPSVVPQGGAPQAPQAPQAAQAPQPAQSAQPAQAPQAPQAAMPVGTAANNTVREGIPATAAGPGATAPYTSPQGVQYGMSDGKPLYTGSLAGMAPQQLLPPHPITGKQDWRTPQEAQQVQEANARFNGQDTDAYNSSSLILARTQQNRDAYNQLRMAGGLMTSGPGSVWRADLVRSASTLNQIVNPGAKPWMPEADMAFTELNKNAVQLGFNGVTQAFGHAGHEAQSIIQASIGAVPGVENTFWSGQLLNRTYEVLAQRQQDEYRFGIDYARQNGNNFSGYQQAYDKLHPIGETINGMLKEFGLGPNGFTGATAAETRENVRTAVRASIISPEQGLDIINGKPARDISGQTAGQTGGQ